MAVVYFERKLSNDCFILAESGGRDEKSRIRRYVLWSYPSPSVFTNYGDVSVNELFAKIRSK